MDVPIFDVQLVLPNLAVHRVYGVAVVLKDEAVGDGGDEVDVDVLRSVWRDVEVVGLGKRCDLHELRDSAENEGIGLQDVDRAVVDHVAESVTSVFVFSRGYGNGSGASDLTLSDVVVRFNWLLEPEEVVFFGFACEFDCFVVAVGVVCIDHQAHIGSDGLAADAHTFDIFIDRNGADFDLDGASTEFDVFGHFGSELFEAFAFFVVTTGDVGVYAVSKTAE